MTDISLRYIDYISVGKDAILVVKLPDYMPAASVCEGFSIKELGFQAALIQALAERDRLVARHNQAPIAPAAPTPPAPAAPAQPIEPKRKRSREPNYQALRSTNKTGKNGVQFYRHNGVVTGYQATWPCKKAPSGTRTKSFPFNVFDKLDAFIMAAQLRDKMTGQPILSEEEYLAVMDIDALEQALA